MKIGLCDDDKVWCDYAEKVIKAFAIKIEINVEISVFQNKQELLQYEKAPMDVLFLDIELGEDNGIAIADEINKRWTGCQIVFLTNYLYYALEIFQTDHIYYVLKEQFEERISEVFNKIIHFFEQNNTKISFRGARGTEIQIYPQEIYYLERNLRQTIVHATWGNFQVKEKLDDILKRLSKYDFSRCHNSYIIYLPAVREKKKASYVLENGKEIAISRGYAKQTKEDWMRWALLQMS